MFYSATFLCGSCHHVQLACHCAVTGKCRGQGTMGGGFGSGSGEGVPVGL